MASLDKDVYAAKHEYNRVAFVLLVMGKRRTLNPQYLHLNSCSAFNQVFTENHISDLKKVRISLCAGCNAGVNSADERGMILGAIKAWLV